MVREHTGIAYANREEEDVAPALNNSKGLRVPLVSSCGPALGSLSGSVRTPGGYNSILSAGYQAFLRLSPTLSH
jgi:hypothetical protein